MERARTEVAWCDNGTGRGWETLPPKRRARSAEVRRSSDTPSAPETTWAKMGVDEKRELASEEAMEKEEWGRTEIWGTG